MVKGVDITTYNYRELVILCPAIVLTIEKLLERYVWGVPQPLQGNVTSFDPATIDEAMRMAHRLMDQAVRAGTVLLEEGVTQETYLHATDVKYIIQAIAP
ncbi:hypothetical protein Tco_0368302 [Tanacetum coccineum]